MGREGAVMGEKRKFQVSFLRENCSVTVEEGTTVLQAEIEGGLQPDAPCGGMGTCGKCKVHILNGSQPGIQKACCVKVTEDLTVDSSVREEGGGNSGKRGEPSGSGKAYGGRGSGQPVSGSL